MKAVKTEHILQSLHEAARTCGFDVRLERGRFRGGHCTVRGQEVILLNKQHPPEVHLAILAECLQGCPLDTIYMRPAIRAAVVDIMRRYQEEADAT